MSIEVINDLDDLLSDAERAHWRNRSQMLFIEQFNDTLGYVREESDRGVLSTNIRSLLNLIERAFGVLPAYAICDMIERLHPLPINEGYSSQWKQHLRRAAVLAEADCDAVRTAALLNVLSSVQYHSGCVDEAIDIAQLALIAARSTHDPVQIASIGGTLVSTMMTVNGRLAEAGRYLQGLWDDPLINSSEGLARVQAQIHLHAVTTFYKRRTEPLDAVLAEIEQAVALATAWSDVEESVRASVHRHRGLIRRLVGQYAEAVDDYQYALNSFIMLHDTTSELLTRGNLALTYWSMGELQLAEAERQRCIDESERLHEYLELTHHIGDLALVYMSQGQFNKALECLIRQAELADQLGLVDEQGRAAGNRGIVLTHLGQFEAAQRDLLNDIRASHYARNVYFAVVGYPSLARCYLGLGMRQLALQCIDRMLYIAKQYNWSDARLLGLRVFAECVEDRDLQRGILTEALTIALGKRPLDEAACLLSLAALTYDPTIRADLWERGAWLLHKIGAAAWLDGHDVNNPPCILALA